MNCGNCNAEVSSSERFCGECGASVSIPQPRQTNESPTPLAGVGAPSKAGRGLVILAVIVLVGIGAIYYLNRDQRTVSDKQVPQHKAAAPGQRTDERPGVPPAPPLEPWRSGKR